MKIKTTKKDGRGRPSFDDEGNQTRRNITLSDTLAEKAKTIGGTVSNGIRRALERFKNEDV